MVTGVRYNPVGGHQCSQ